jgi:DNA mismatch repair protein MSH5
MDTHIGDLHPLIVGLYSSAFLNPLLSSPSTDREIEILQTLLERVMVYDEAMGRACDVCAELDCLLSFAEVSKIFDYRRPNMVDENVIYIQQGRYKVFLSLDFKYSREYGADIRFRNRWWIRLFLIMPMS